MPPLQSCRDHDCEFAAADDDDNDDDGDDADDADDADDGGGDGDDGDGWWCGRRCGV